MVGRSPVAASEEQHCGRLQDRAIAAKRISGSGASGVADALGLNQPAYCGGAYQRAQLGVIS
jgi:hypothetical protein